MLRQGQDQSVRLSRRRLVASTAAAAAAAAATGTAMAAPIGVPQLLKYAGQADQPIKIGVISPLSGAWTVYGTAHSQGFQLAVDEINAKGGVLGRQIEIVLADSKTEPRIVVEQANRLIREEKVDLLAGTFSSAERNAAGPVVNSAHKILLYPTFYEGQSQEFYPGVCNKVIFMFGPVPSQQVNPHMEYMTEKYGKNFYMVGSDYVWPRETNARVKEALDKIGGAVVGEDYIPFDTSEYDSVLRKIRDSGADIVFGTLTGTDTVNFARQFYGAGMNDQFTYWTVDDEEFATKGKGPEASAGTYVSFDYFMAIPTPENTAFLERLRAKYGADAGTDTVGVAMYNAAHMFALAAEKAESIETDALIAALEGIEFTGPQGSVKMRAEDHQMVLPSYLAQVNEGWTSFDDMFTIVQSSGLVEPAASACTLPLTTG
jgi:urea transport system substrate-binding protein